MDKYIAVALVLVVTVAIGVAVFMGNGTTSVQGGVQNVIHDTVEQLNDITE